MKKLNDKNFHRAIKAKRLVVMFWAKWAGPCNLVRPAYEDVADRLHTDADFAEFDIDDNPTVPEKYGVRAVPTFIVFSNGIPEIVKAGAIPAEVIENMANPPPPVAKQKKAKK